MTGIVGMLRGVAFFPGRFLWLVLVLLLLLLWFLLRDGVDN